MAKMSRRVRCVVDGFSGAPAIDLDGRLSRNQLLFFEAVANSENTRHNGSQEEGDPILPLPSPKK
jgi:hypothetical protein